MLPDLRLSGSVLPRPVRQQQHAASRRELLILLLCSLTTSAAHRTHNQPSPPVPPPRPPPLQPPPPSRPPAGAREVCLSFPAVRISGDRLLLNNLADGYDTRFFMAGWVGSGGAPLTEYNRTHMDTVLRDSAMMGATTFRWKCALKGF